MVYALQKGRDCHTNLNFSFLIIYITVILHRKKFCDGHIILIFSSMRLFLDCFTAQVLSKVHLFKVNAFEFVDKS